MNLFWKIYFNIYRSDNPGQECHYFVIIFLLDINIIHIFKTVTMVLIRYSIIFYPFWHPLYLSCLVLISLVFPLLQSFLFELLLPTLFWYLITLTKLHDQPFGMTRSWLSCSRIFQIHQRSYHTCRKSAQKYISNSPRQSISRYALRIGFLDGNSIL